MNRLNNAVKQRNAAREEALLASEKLKKLEEDLESGRLAPAGPSPSPGAATPLGTPTADGAAPDEPGTARVSGSSHPAFSHDVTGICSAALARSVMRADVMNFVQPIGDLTSLLMRSRTMSTLLCEVVMLARYPLE